MCKQGHISVTVEENGVGEKAHFPYNTNFKPLKPAVKKETILQP